MKKMLHETLYEEAVNIAGGIDRFYEKIGPDPGNKKTDLFQKSLREIVNAHYKGKIEVAKPVLGGPKYAFDYYIASENTAIELKAG